MCPELCLKRQLERDGPAEEAAPKKKVAKVVSTEDGSDPYEGLNSKEKRLLKRKLERGGEEEETTAAEDDAPKVEESCRICLRNLHRYVTEEAIMEVRVS